MIKFNFYFPFVFLCKLANISHTVQHHTTPHHTTPCHSRYLPSKPLWCVQHLLYTVLPLPSTTPLIVVGHLLPLSSPLLLSLSRPVPSHLLSAPPLLLSSSFSASRHLLLSSPLFLSSLPLLSLSLSLPRLKFFSTFPPSSSLFLSNSTLLV